MSSGLQIDPNQQGWETELDDIGEALVDADIGMVYNSSLGKRVRFAFSRLKTYISSAAWNGDINDVDTTSGSEIGEALQDTDRLLGDNDSSGNPVWVLLSRIKTYIQALTDTLYAPSDVDYTDVSANDAATDVTGAELEELTDGSETSKHSHSIVLADSLLASPAANFDLTSISSAYKHLRLWYWLRSDRVSNTTDQIRLVINNDSGANYEWTIFYYLHSATFGTVLGTGDNALSVAFATTAVDPAGYFASGWIDIFNYTDASYPKYLQTRGGLVADLATTYPRIYDSSTIWYGTPAAVSRLTLFPFVGSNWTVGSRVMLVGIK